MRVGKTKWTSEHGQKSGKWVWTCVYIILWISESAYNLFFLIYIVGYITKQFGFAYNEKIVYMDELLWMIYVIILNDETVLYKFVVQCFCLCNAILNVSFLIYQALCTLSHWLNRSLYHVVHIHVEDTPDTCLFFNQERPVQKWCLWLYQDNLSEEDIS